MPDVCRSEMLDLIDSWIMNQRNRAILARRLVDGVRFEALAEEFDLSVSQVKRIVDSGKRTILSHCR